MGEIFYKPQNGWVGDLIPFSHDGKFYLFYLHDKREGKNLDDYGFRTTWNLLITTDGTDITDHGVVLPTGNNDDIDESCYTGSVIEDRNGVFHMFYTAQNVSLSRYSRDGRPLQFIMHATSRDLITWEKHYDSAFGADETIYEAHDWRDPYVFFHEADSCYYMLVAAREKGAPQKTGGCIALCKSADLWNWEAQKPFYSPRAYMTHECPDLFQLNDWWYLVYSTFTERFVTHYRYSKSIFGPWNAPIEDSFDGRAFYAAKTAELRGERWCFAWTPSKRGENDMGMWEWGGTLVMHQLSQQRDGRLFVSLPKGVENRFTEMKPNVLEDGDLAIEKSVVVSAEYGTAALRLKNLPIVCMIEADIAFSSEIRNFGIGIRQDAMYEDGYFFRLEPYYNRVVFDLWPRRAPGVNQWYLDGDKPFVVELERPYQMAHLQSIHIKLIVDGDICVFYVDDAVAMTTRTFNLKHDGWSFFAFDGTIEVSNIRLRIK
jgi:beta-fructofuranosidase